MNQKLHDLIYDSLTNHGVLTELEAWNNLQSLKQNISVDAPLTTVANVIRQHLAEHNDGIPPEGRDAELVEAFEGVEQELYEAKEAAMIKGY